MRKALEEGSEALHEAAASFIAASKSVSEEFNRSADRHIAASDEAVESLLNAASESSKRFAAVAHEAAESLREAVVGLSEASKELSRAAREAGEALKKDAKSAADEIPQAGKNSDTAAARGGDGPRRRSPSRPLAPRANRTATGASPLVRASVARIKRPPAGRARSIGQPDHYSAICAMRERREQHLVGRFCSGMTFSEGAVVQRYNRDLPSAGRTEPRPARTRTRPLSLAVATENPRDFLRCISCVPPGKRMKRTNKEEQHAEVEYWRPGGHDRRAGCRSRDHCQRGADR